jgi:hypothetical protein
MTNPHLPVSVYFDACVATSYNVDADISGINNSLVGKESYKGKQVICEKQTAGYRYGCYRDAWMCPRWGCVTWATWAGACENNKPAILQKGVAPLNCPWGACEFHHP